MIYKLLSIPLLTVLLLLTLNGCGSSGTGSQNGGEENLPINTADQTAPVLTLLGEDTIYLNLGENFNDPGATALDNIDGDISSNIQITSNIDTGTAGKYTIIYSITDRAGNLNSIKRKVEVYEITSTFSPRGGLTINEVLASNASTNLDPDYKSFSDWIELYNNSTTQIDVGNYYLGDDESNPKKWRIPSGTVIAAHGYLLIWADSKDVGLHTNFRLDADGESVTLYHSNGSQLIDKITFGKQKSDVSCSLMDGKIYYVVPTPNAQNNQHAMTPSKRSKKPTFSKESGFYTTAVSVELAQINGGDIYYTLDGSTPTRNSTKYASPITLTETRMIRARSYDSDYLPSKVNAHTYLINEDISLPVVSVAIDHKYLYDDKIGIYTVGTDDNGIAFDSDPSQFRLANYGQDWERPASFEYIVNNQAVLSENVGIKIHGRYSRALPQKSFNIYAGKKYDGSYLNYPLFPNKPQVKKVKSFTLRNSGGDWGYTMFRDAMTQSLIKDTTSLDYQDYQPAILFLNGQYWGIQNIRERSNSELIRSNHGIKTGDMDLLAKTVEEQEVYEGDNSDYAAMIAYIHSHSLVSSTDYNYISSKMDIDNYIDYMVTEMFIGADDWPLNNNKYWRERTASGKWRSILFDTDSGFWHYKVNNDPFDYLLNTASYNGGKNTPEATFLFRSLMENNTFKAKFLAKFKAHLDTTFAPSRVVSIIDGYEEKLDPEIQRHITRWSNTYDPVNNRVETKAAWEQHIENLKSFARERVTVIRGLLSQQ